MNINVKAPPGVKMPETITLPFPLAAAIAGALTKTLSDRATLLSFQSAALAAALSPSTEHRDRFFEKVLTFTPAATHRAMKTITAVRKIEKKLDDKMMSAVMEANGGKVLDGMMNAFVSLGDNSLTEAMNALRTLLDTAPKSDAARPATAAATDGERNAGSASAHTADAEEYAALVRDAADLDLGEPRGQAEFVRIWRRAEALAAAARPQERTHLALRRDSLAMRFAVEREKLRTTIAGLESVPATIRSDSQNAQLERLHAREADLISDGASIGVDLDSIETGLVRKAA